MHLITASALARGHYVAIGEGPLLVSDPLKARYLLGLDRKAPSPRARKRHEHGLLPVSYFRSAIPRLKQTALRELERLLSGAPVLFVDEYSNRVVNQGLNEILDVTIGGVANDTTWFVGLTDGTPTDAAGDTLASHAGWVEVTNYDEVNRVAWTPNGAASTQSVSNSSSPAAFTISATVTIGGSFLADVNTGNGTGNSLYSVGAFTAGDKLLNDNDTLSVTATFTTATA